MQATLGVGLPIALAVDIEGVRTRCIGQLGSISPLHDIPLRSLTISCTALIAVPLYEPGLAEIVDHNITKVGLS
jgi:hypothetical protein